MTLERLVLCIVDGLRPDAITPATMPALHALGARGWRATADTVEPSVTVAALGSLASGVAPAVHRLEEGKLPPVRSLRRLTPLPRVLRQHGRHSAIVTPHLAPPRRFLARSLLGLAGVGSFAAGGRQPCEVAETALAHFARLAPAFGVVYLNHCDVAGHRAGWMGEAYLAAAHACDAALAALAAELGDPGTGLLVVSDHGGGGVVPTDHGEPHPLNRTIPLVAAGARLARGPGAHAHLLDLPPTIADLLGVPVPAEWAGRPLPLRAREAAQAA